MFQSPNPRGQRGAALLLVLWVLALLTLLAAAALQIVVDAGHVAEAMQQRSRLLAAADGAVNQFLLQLSNRKGDWSLDSAPQTVQIGGIEVSVSAIDEAGQLNVNRAPAELLQAFFLASGASSSEATRWSQLLSNGRENSLAPDLNPPEVRLFRTLDEAGATAGIPAHLFECLRPSLTVFSSSAGVNARYASAAVRRALHADPDDPARTGLGEGTSPVGRVLSVMADAKIGNARFLRHAVVRLTGDPAHFLMVAAWETGFVPEIPTACGYQ